MLAPQPVAQQFQGRVVERRGAWLWGWTLASSAACWAARPAFSSCRGAPCCLRERRSLLEEEPSHLLTLKAHTRVAAKMRARNSQSQRWDKEAKGSPAAGRVAAVSLRGGQVVESPWPLGLLIEPAWFLEHRHSHSQLHHTWAEGTLQAPHHVALQKAWRVGRAEPSQL
jgi:hypothetical protein